jgi:hypothetical protein
VLLPASFSPSHLSVYHFTRRELLNAIAVNLALPALRHDLGGGITGLQW